MIALCAVQALLVPLLASASPVVIADSEANLPEIVGGDPVLAGAWQVVVGVQAGSRVCSGSLVAPDLILTAAHCIPDNTNPEDVVITFGDDLDAPEAQFVAIEVETHPDYCAVLCGEDRYDFAYVRMESQVFLDPLPLITEQSVYDGALGVGDDVLLVGYGLDDDGVSGIKREVTTPVTGHSKTGKEFAAGGGGKDSCQGDSGGPAIVFSVDGTAYLAGVLSRGFDCGDGGFYGNPYEIACWITAQTGVVLSPECETCDCVDLRSHVNGTDKNCGNCSVEAEDQTTGTTPLLIAIVVSAGVWWRRRRPVGAGHAAL